MVTVISSSSKVLTASSLAVYCVNPGSSKFVWYTVLLTILNTQRRQARVVGIVARLWGWMVQSMNPTRGKRYVSPPKPLD